MPVFQDVVAPVERDDLYRDGLLLNDKLIALKTAISQDKRAQPGNLLGSLFSNLGLFQPSATGSAQPSLGMLFLSNFFWVGSYLVSKYSFVEILCAAL